MVDFFYTNMFFFCVSFLCRILFSQIFALPPLMGGIWMIYLMAGQRPDDYSIMSSSSSLAGAAPGTTVSLNNLLHTNTDPSFFSLSFFVIILRWCFFLHLIQVLKYLLCNFIFLFLAISLLALSREGFQRQADVPFRNSLCPVDGPHSPA